ncbi:MAG: DCC1-like thiol-disulfide oxidoreductase family protein [Woeseiaceae bacterium]|nr:DCC1-like thiol-disulfide oxidoreductase family protein [Woeseiaceae bacterium]
MRLSSEPYSFVDDPAVPRFDVPDYFTVMDADCGLCAKGAAWIARNDADEKFRIVPVQSDLGAALLRHYGMDPEDPLSWLYVENGRAHTSLDAIVRVGKEFGGIWKMLSIFNLLPRGAQDYLYGVMARNRYKFLGRKSFCDMPDPGIQSRVLRQ